MIAFNANSRAPHAFEYDAVRWISRDPIGEPGGINLYDYVHNRPLTTTDPSGKFGVAGAIYGAIAGGVGGAITGYAHCHSFEGALEGAALGGVIGGLVGIVAPEFSGAAANMATAAVVGAASSYAGQVAGNAVTRNTGVTS